MAVVATVEATRDMSISVRAIPSAAALIVPTRSLRGKTEIINSVTHVTGRSDGGPRDNYIFAYASVVHWSASVSQRAPVPVFRRPWRRGISVCWGERCPGTHREV